MSELITKHCKVCKGETLPLNEHEVHNFLRQVPKWTLSDQTPEINRTFHFKDYYHTMTFVNAVAWIAHQQGHHPDLEVYYDKCCVRYSTHAINGLSENDFICAAKINMLIMT